ncbi:hypothetical protein HaLaN_12550 [Haematococcus lacustris]|uniref:Uncharacterized protein n=1 Tax=Haematococcus lacustris TaxID=44745 RepID=A0A699Z0Y7_HAELA|nr:hypothetical protein HaLaN_12550 [Haematococcus lacustris]
MPPFLRPVARCECYGPLHHFPAGSYSQKSLASVQDGRVCLHDMASAGTSLHGQFKLSGHLGAGSSDDPTLSSLCFSPVQPKLLFCSQAKTIYCKDLRQAPNTSAQVFTVSRDDINQGSCTDADGTESATLPWLARHRPRLHTEDQAADITNPSTLPTLWEALWAIGHYELTQLHHLTQRGIL